MPVKILKDQVSWYWNELIEIDGNGIFCYLSARLDFICIEKTEDVIVGKNEGAWVWLYEVTISSAELKDELKSYTT